MDQNDDDVPCREVGVNVEVDNAPWKVVEFMHVKPGKGSAFVRSKLKNYLTKSTNEKTFRAGGAHSLSDTIAYQDPWSIHARVFARHAGPRSD